jgi:hypothetical protein
LCCLARPAATEAPAHARRAGSAAGSASDQQQHQQQQHRQDLRSGVRLQDLPDQAWAAILQRLGLPDLLSLRRAARALAGLGASRVRGLCTSREGRLPASAWAAFPRATSLSLGGTQLPAGEAASFHSLQEAGSAAAYMRPSALAATLADAPSRLQSLEAINTSCGLEDAAVVVGVLAARHRSNQDATAAASTSPQQQQQPPGSMALQQLALHVPLGTELADILCTSCTSLQDLSLTLEHVQRQPGSVGGAGWSPALQQLSRLRRLELYVNIANIELDLSPVASCSGSLEELSVPGTPSHSLDHLQSFQLKGISSLAALVKLRRLQLPWKCSLAAGKAPADWGSILGSMQQLEELGAGFLECSSGLWQLLASLPKLRSIILWRLALNGAEQPATQLQSLTLGDLVLEGGAQHQPMGCLAQLLPNLTFLHQFISRSDVSSWAAAVRGHPSLQRFKLTVRQARFESHLLQLSSWPQLRDVDLKFFNDMDHAALLADLAQLPLETLKLALLTPYCDSQLRQRGLQALAVGPAGQTLRLVNLELPNLSLQEVAALVAAPSRIREVAVYARLARPLPAQDATADAVAQAVVSQLQQQGVAVAGVVSAVAIPEEGNVCVRVRLEGGCEMECKVQVACGDEDKDEMDDEEEDELGGEGW